MNVIDKAAERLRGRWQQGSIGRFRDPQEPVCLIGALFAVDADPNKIAIVSDALGADHPSERLLATFNDDPATTEEDVLLLLKKASALYDERTEQAS